MTELPREIKNALNEEEQFQELYVQYKRKVLNTALNMVQNLQDAEEIMQDVFVELYFKIDQFRKEASISTWIYRITINKSLDVIKKKKRKKRFAWLTGIFDPESGRELHIISDFMHPGIALERQEQMRLLFEYIEKLPDKQKSALILSVVEQLSYKEISGIMNVSVSSVESLIFRARQNLKKWIEKYDSNPELLPQLNSVAIV